ncbi:MAG: UDP-N-acetylmuramate dehydrogenase [Eubacterium sp.]|nr:UDP-N-acetylmuramate dehydrogenase [Eubacterium sp.]
MIELRNEPLSAHTSFRIGGPADYYLIPETVEDLVEALDMAREKELPFYILGKGSNVLFSDQGFRGLVIEIGKGLSRIDILEDGKVRVQAGASMAAMANRLAEKSLAGFEFASGIPGSLGGGIAMNAGAYGGEIKDCILSARVLTPEGQIKELALEELELGYRTSIIQKKDYIVLEACFQFQKGDETAIRALMKDLNGRRKEKQPLEFPSAGSTFKRPEGYFAGKLIQDAGLSGYTVGGAQVSEKHCGFVINRGGASAKDVMDLIQDVKDKVYEAFGVELEPEVRLIPEEGFSRK